MTVLELHNPIAQVARELDEPENTRHGWLKAAQPVGGSGRLRAEDQASRDLQRRIRDREEENAI